MYRYALSIIGGLFIGWNICLAATNSDLHSRNAEGGGISTRYCPSPKTNFSDGSIRS